MSNAQVAEPARKTQSLVLRNAIILVGAQVLGTPLSIFMNAVLGRYLGAADFGRIYLMTTFCQLGFLFVDWGQNDHSKSTVCAYSLRGKERPTVSMPVAWDELDDPAALAFEWNDALARIERDGDIFAPVLTLKQELPATGS